MKEIFDDFLMRNPGTGSSKCKETGKISARKIRKKENWVEKEKKKGLFFRVLGVLKAKIMRLILKCGPLVIPPDKDSIFSP